MAGRYRLEERLGTGGTADVWRAQDVRTAERVAVKLLHPHLLPDALSRERFAAEARAAGSVSHPGVVGLRALLLGPDEAALVFDHVAGGSLADRLAREGRLPPQESARIAAEVAEALSEAHRHGVVHRDVTPGNVLLEPDGRARLSDFGIARSLEGSGARLTLTGTVMGTLRYMAPEQLAGEPAESRTDLYALGAVLYEMLAGRPAFDARNPVAFVEQQRNAPPPIPEAPPELAAIALAALEREPADRPASAAAIAAALRHWLATGGGRAVAGAVSVDPDAVTAPQALPPGAGESDAGTSSSGGARRAGPLAWLALVGVLLIGGLAVAGSLGLGGSGAARAVPSPPPATTRSAPTAAPTPVATTPLPVAGPGRGGHGKRGKGGGDG